MGNNVYEIITGKVIEQLEKGIIPWRKPWAVKGQFPMNLVSKRRYSGINVLLLAMQREFSSPYWLTYKQAQELGGNVRKGEKSSLVTFFKELEFTEDRQGNPLDEVKHVGMLRYYNVFNVGQCDGIESPSAEAPKHTFTAIENAETIHNTYFAAKSSPTLKLQAKGAFYRPLEDTIYLPDKSTFSQSPDFYATLFHEMIHSTGHKDRLARKGVTEGTFAAFGDEVYSQEELVAEMGSAFLCGESGIESTLDNSASYLCHWIKALKADQRMLVFAASQAQKASDFIMGR